MHMIQSWNRSGRTGQDRTKSSCGRTKPDFCRIFFDFFVGFFAGFLPDFCQCDVKNEPDGFYRIFFNFFARFFVRFLADFCQFDVKNEPNFFRFFCRIDVKNDPVGFRPDRTGQILKLAGPDQIQKNPSGSNSEGVCNSDCYINSSFIIGY